MSYATMPATITSEVDIRYRRDGSGVCEFDVRPEYGDKDWGWHVVVRGTELSENCALTLTNGTEVVLVGRFGQSASDGPTEFQAGAVAVSLRHATADVQTRGEEPAASR